MSQYVPVELIKENELNFNPEVTSPIFRFVASFPKNNEENCFTIQYLIIHKFQAPIFNDTSTANFYGCRFGIVIAL